MRKRGRAPTMGALAEETKSSWARHIPSYAAVPPVYQGFFEPLLAEGRAFPYTVLTPSYDKFIHRTTEKLICEFGRQVHVLERSGSTFDAQSFPLEAISYVRVRTVLLDSDITLCGVTQQGAPACCTIRFNSVTDYLLRPIVEWIRLAAFDTQSPVQSLDRSAFDHLVRVNYKFMSFARQSLLAGEKVIHTTLQPEIREPVLSVFGKTFHRTVSPTHMSILTERELIMIGEEQVRSAEDRYGGIWEYIPLNKIRALSVSSKGSDLLGLSLQLPESACLDYLFEASARRDVERLLDLARELIP